MQPPEKSGLTALGKIFVGLFILGCAAGAYYYLAGGGAPPRGSDGVGSVTAVPAGGGGRSGGVEIGIAYGTEKRRWLEWAAAEFARTDAGQRIGIQLKPMGSLEGAQALLKGDESIHVWAPASALYTDVFVQEWEVKHGRRDPLLTADALALSPMVLVMWDQRFSAFQQRYERLDFDQIGEALAEVSGWDGIAEKPEWGLFKFGHTHPNQSNSGITTLVLMAYDYHKKRTDLALKDILDPGFQGWMQQIERAVSGLPNSTGNMMRDMVLKGPSAYDAVCVYENVVIDFLKNAEGRWGSLEVAYPAYNMWNENPYYVIDAPWSDDRHKEGAREFLRFLLSEEIQQNALTHGFRPGNPAVPIKLAESPFTKYASYGIKVDLASVCEPPSAEVVNNLLASWQRGQGAR